MTDRRVPTDSVSVGPLGKFGVFRPKQGPSGTWHWGVDLAEPQGSPVFAPERMTIVAVWRDDKTAPFVGYGPAGVLAQGIGPGNIGQPHYHLLAHLDPGGWDDNGIRSDVDAAGVVIPLDRVLTPTKGETFEAGQQVGVISNLGHTHWEIRREPIDSPSTRAGNTYDPLAWVKDGSLNMVTLPDPTDWSWLWWVAAIYLLAR